MKLCDTCELKSLCDLPKAEAESTVEAYYEINDDEVDCLDVETLVEAGHTEDEAETILKCLMRRTIMDCSVEPNQYAMN